MAGHRCAYSAHFRPEIERTFSDSVIQQLDTECIAGQNQALFPDVPNRQAEHAIETIQYFVAPMLVSVNNDFRIGIGLEYVAEALEFLSEFFKVINLAVEDHPDGFFSIGHGLMTASQIDNRKAAEAKSEWTVEVVAFVVGASVSDSPGHRFNVRATHRC